MKMCTICHAQYRDNDAIDQQFCSAVPMEISSVIETFASCITVTAEKMIPAGEEKCGGQLKEVKCLKCLDTGSVSIKDPRDSRAENIACPNGCSETI